jgi:hypothetical protein
MVRAWVPQSGAGLRGTLIALLVVVSASLGAAPVAADEDPRFEVSVPEPELEPGTQSTLDLAITNDAEAVEDHATTASNVRVTARAGSTPIEVISGERRLGQLADGATASLSVRIEVPADAPGGSYDLPLDVVYEYEGDERERTTVHATVEIPERPIFSIATERVDLHPKETGAVTLGVENVGSRTANQTQATVTAPGSGIAVGGDNGATPHLGALRPGQSVEVTVPVSATGAASASTLRIVPTYENVNGVTVTAPARSIGVSPGADPRFVPVSRSVQVSPGETGTAEWVLENRGGSIARNVVVSIETTDPAVSFDAGTTTTRFVPAWEPGERVTVETPIRVGSGARNGSYPVVMTVAFEHAAGFDSTAGPYGLGAPVSAIGAVSFADMELTHGGPQAVLSGTVTNDGQRTLENAVVDVAALTDGVSAVDGRTAVGTLEPGETAPVSATVRTGTSDPRPLRFEGQLRYGVDGDVATSVPTSFRVEGAESESLFDVEGVNATLSVDASNELRVRIENRHDAELTDLRARLAADSPYASQSPTAYVGSLAPGTSTVVTFEVTTPEDGVPTRDALQVNVTGETDADRVVRDGPHTVPVTVGGGEAGGSSVLVGVLAVVVIALLGGGWWWLNR